MKFRILSFLASLIFSLSAMANTNVTITDVDAKDYTGNFSVSVEPLYILLNGIGLGVDYNISPKLSAGLRYNGIFNLSMNRDDNYSIYNYVADQNEARIGATYMITGEHATKGIYISAGVGYIQSKVTESSFNYSGSIESPLYRITAGAKWSASDKGRLSFIAGLGVMSLIGDTTTIVVKDSDGNIISDKDYSTISGLAFDLGMQYTF